MFRKPQAPVVSEHAKLSNSDSIEVDHVRSRQVSEFLKLNPSAQLVQNGPSVNGQQDSTAIYTIQLSTHSAGILTLTITLGPLFPERPPMCQLSTSVSHQRLHHKYLDGHGYLSLHPKLQPAHWSPHQNLGLLVQEMVHEFIQSPPQIVGATTPAFSAQSPSPFMQEQQQQMHQQQQMRQPPIQPPYQGYAQQPQGNGYMQHQQQPPAASSSSPLNYQAAPSPSPHPQSSPSMQPHPHPNASVASVPPIPRRPSYSGSSPASAAGQQQQQQPQRTRPPDVPSSFPSLDALSIAQLEALLGGTPEEQRDSIRDLASEQPQATQLDGVVQELCTKIEIVAKENLAKRDQLESLTARVNTEASKLREQQQLYVQLLQRQQAAAQRYALSNVLHLLDASISSIEEQSESTKDRYEAQNLKSSGEAADHTQFEQYIRERMILHERAAKKERLIEAYGRA